LKGATVLLSELSPDPDWEDDFNHWYDTHQIPVRMNVPGFVSAQRYCDTDRPNYLGLFEITDLSVLDSAEYEKVKSQPNAQTAWMLSNTLDYARYLGREISDQKRDEIGDDDSLNAPILYAVYFSVPDDRVEEFNKWYDEEHAPMLLKCPDWYRIRRIEIVDGEPQPWTHLSLHYLADMSALDSSERQAARDTDWYKKLAEEPWFRSSYSIYDRIGDRFMGSAPAAA
tara:strand:- start:90 stop:770 length:681 start_codon:yes stop_codon:yes gene_type:complete